MGTLVRRDPNTQVAHVFVVLLRERLLDDHDLLACADLLCTVDEPPEPVFGVVSPVGVEVVGDLAVFGMRDPLPTDRFVDFFEPRHVPCQHLVLVAIAVRVGPDLDLEEEVARVDLRDYLVDRDGVGHQRDTREFAMLVGQRGPIRLGHHLVEIVDSVLLGEQLPQRVIDRHQRV